MKTERRMIGIKKEMEEIEDAVDEHVRCAKIFTELGSGCRW